MATNPWARFKRLIPQTPLTIVTVYSVGTDGTSIVTTSSGGSMRVFGTSVTAGNKAYIRAGAIVGPAPNLTHYELTA